MDALTAIEIVEGCDESEQWPVDEETATAAWQLLIDRGLVWTLQGWFGRQAKYLIEQGACVDTHNVLGGS